MADPGIKNVVIKKELLGKVTQDNGRVVRFRMVAEDKNRKSAWSQIFLVVDSQTVKELPGDIEVVGNTIFVNWSNSSNPTEQTKYDIFAKYDSADPVHIGITTGTSFSFLKTGSPQSVKVIVQLASIKPAISTALKVFESSTRSLV
jgi:hypothetical protein